MTAFGKLLVNLNIAAAVLMLAIAVGTFMTRMPFRTPDPVEGEDGPPPPGMIAVVAKQIELLTASRDEAEVRWFRHRKDLADVENIRPGRQRWYAETLKIIATGTDNEDKPVKPAIPELNLPEKVDPIVGYKLYELKRNYPSVKILDVDAKPLAEYRAEVEKLNKEIIELQAEYKKLIAEEKELTEKLNGKKMGDEVVKGLRQLLSEQVAFAVLARDEQVYLQPHTANLWAEAQLLLKRRASLEARVSELKRFYETTALSSGQ